MKTLSFGLELNVPERWASSFRGASVKQKVYMIQRFMELEPESVHYLLPEPRVECEDNKPTIS